MGVLFGIMLSAFENMGPPVPVPGQPLPPQPQGFKEQV